MNSFKRSFGWATAFTPVLLLATSVSVAMAQQTTAPSPITTKGQLGDFLCSIINWFFWILIILSVIMVLVAAFDYITAGDDTEKTTRGRKRLTYAAIGIAVALLAYGFPQIVATVFPNNAVGTGVVSCTG